MMKQTKLTYMAPFLLVAAAGLVTALGMRAQQQPGPAPRVPAESAAPIDLTGYWVSIVTEDWRFRMIVPDKGDYASVPLTPEGRKILGTWDPAKDQAEGNQCKSYGAAAIMRVPGRLHISWENNDTLRIDTDSGTQSRLLHFDPSPPANEAASWQGYSVADWEGERPMPAFMRRANPPNQPPEGYLKVITTHMRPGYLRKNGVPYSGDAVLEEYFDTFKELNGDQWLVVTSVVTDPAYLFQPFITSTHFKKLSSDSGWDPTECHANQPR